MRLSDEKCDKTLGACDGVGIKIFRRRRPQAKPRPVCGNMRQRARHRRLKREISSQYEGRYRRRLCAGGEAMPHRSIICP